MADRLTAQQLIDYAQPTLHKKVTRTATLDNDAISATDITSYVKRWGSITFSTYNNSPSDRGQIRIPVVELQVDNTEGTFDLGGSLFPNGRSDFESASLRVQVEIGGTTFLDFTGRLREPETNERGIILLLAEHPLVQMMTRKWTREDRIGGDTGVDWGFSS